MIQHYRPLFTVAAQHSYYADRCEDFEFFPSAGTARALRGGKVQIRLLQGCLHAIYEADAAGAPLNSLVGRTLLFGLKLRNRFFSNFTAPVLSNPALIPLYDNSDDPSALAPPAGVVLTSGFYQHQPQTLSRPLLLRLSSAAGNTIAIQTLPPGIHSCTFDLRGLIEGSYHIREDDGEGNVTERQLIVSPELQRTDLWGLLSIRVTAGYYNSPAAFTLNFSARQDLLKYYVVADHFSQPEFEQLQVTDNGFSEQGRTQLHFTRVPSVDFTTADPEPSLLGKDHDRVVLFQSTEQVARGERGLRKLQLHRNGDILVAHLPQPAVERQQAQFVVHLSKP